MSARVDAREGAGGLAGRQSDDAWFAIEAHEVATGMQVSARAAVSSLEQIWTQDFPRGDVELFIAIEAPSSATPRRQAADRITLGARIDGEEHVLARLDGRHWSFETTGSFTGRVLGVYASAGSVEFTEFTYTD